MSDTLAPLQPAGVLLLLGGPAGAGKSTLAAAWCRTRPSAVHVELDRVRERIVSGRADPQQPNDRQSEQYALSVAASIGLARPFLAAGYDVAIDDVLEPAAYERFWLPHLGGLKPRIFIVLPALATALARSTARSKRVLAAHTLSQHAACAGWPARYRLDTTDLTADESLALLHAQLVTPPLALPLVEPFC